MFLLGFIPQFRNADRLQGEVSLRDQRIERLQREAALSKARHLASLHVEVARGNYGVAEKHATASFNHVRAIMGEASFTPLKGGIDDILGQREAHTHVFPPAVVWNASVVSLISSIAKSNSVAETRAREMLLRTHQLALP